MVYKKDTRKKHKVLICDEKGPPPYDISANSLKFKDWYDEGFIVPPVRDQLLTNERELVGVTRMYEAWQFIKTFEICQEKDYPTNVDYKRNDTPIDVEAELKIHTFGESETVKEMQLIDQLNKGSVVARVAMKRCLIEHTIWQDISANSLKFKDWYDEGFIVSPVRDQLLINAMVYKKDTRKKHKVLICDEKGSPPYDISANLLKFKDWYDEVFIVSPVRDQLLTNECELVGVTRMYEAWQFIKTFGICQEKDYPTNVDYKRNDTPIDVEAEDISANSLKFKDWYDEGFIVSPVRDQLLTSAMVYKKDTRKKHKLLICDEKGPPPNDISANSLKFKDWYDEGFIVSPVRDQLLTMKEMQLVDQLNKGPVVARVKTYPSFCNWKYRKEDDIYYGPTSKDKIGVGVLGEHALVLIEYGQTEGGVPFFRCMNSNGTSWGCNGLGKIVSHVQREKGSLITSYSYCDVADS
ncbi:hypothetical protein LINPERHAP2_LOCUS28072 [Linum perenne]